MELGGLRMKTKVTIKPEATLLREASELAAQEGMSINALLAMCLEHVVNNRLPYACARRRALARLRKGLDLHWTPQRSRDELHER